MSNEKFLILTADDFGASTNINEGIEIAANANAITTISALTNFTESLPHLKKIADKHPEIGIGVHLNITTGKPVLGAKEVPTLVNTNGNFHPLEELLPLLQKLSPADLRKELRAQIITLLNSGIKIDHLSDQNGIITFYSPFFDIMLELAVEFNVPVRSPEIACVKYPGLFPDSKMNMHGRKIAMHLAAREPLKAMNLLKYTRLPEIGRKVQKLDELGILHPGLMIEYFWGNPTELNLLYILEHLPQGSSELVLHLGTDTKQNNYPTGLDLEYFNNREKELSAITSDSIVGIYNKLNITPIGYQDIGKLKQLSQKDE